MQIVDCRDWSERRRGGDQGPGPLRPGSKESRVERRDAGNYPPTLSTSDLYLKSETKAKYVCCVKCHSKGNIKHDACLHRFTTNFIIHFYVVFDKIIKIKYFLQASNAFHEKKGTFELREKTMLPILCKMYKYLPIKGPLSNKMLVFPEVRNIFFM